jgi:hypothetical protein
MWCFVYAVLWILCVKFQEESDNLFRVTTLHEGIDGLIKYLLVYRMLQTEFMEYDEIYCYKY